MEAAERIEIIRRLVSFENRWAGTDEERRAAEDLAKQLNTAGFRAEVQPTYVHPDFSAIHAAHVAIAIAGSIVGAYVPVAGFVTVLLVAVSLYGDLNTRWYLLRRLFFRRASQNVVARGTRRDAPERVILTAHYDAARTGAIYDRKRLKRGAKLQRRLPFALGPYRILFWGVFPPLLAALGLRMAGIEGIGVSLAHALPTILLIIALPFLLDISLSDVVPGANDNASGVATVISLAEILEEEPPRNVDVWVVLPGAEECLMEGMRSFVRQNRRKLDKAGTWFINVDTVGNGVIHFQTHEGFAVSYDFDKRLVELCDAIATADREDGNRFAVQPLAHAFGTDALPPRLAGFRSISILGADEDGAPPPGYHTKGDTLDRIDPEVLDRAHDFVLELVRRIDRDAGRRRRAIDSAEEGDPGKDGEGPDSGTGGGGGKAPRRGLRRRGRGAVG